MSLLGPLAPRVAALVRPHAPALVAAVALAGVVAACRGGLVWLVRDVLDALLDAGDPRAATALPAAIVLLFVIQGAARAARTWLTRRAAIEAEATLRQRLFEHLLAQPAARVAAAGVGDRLSRLSHDAGTVRTAMGAAVTVVQRPLSALALLGVAGFMAPELFVLALLGLPVVAGVVAWTGRRTRHAAEAHGAALGQMELFARDALRGLRTLQAHGAQQATAATYRQRNAEQVDAALRTTSLRVVGPPLVELAGAVAVAAVIALGAGRVAEGSMTAGELVGFLVALGMLNEPLKGFAVAHGLWSEASGGLARVFEVLDEPIEQDEPGAGELASSAPVVTLRGVRVDRGRGPILAGVDLTLRPGELVVLQGESGAGKSTLLDVIAGFCPWEGRVSWDGRDARGLTLASRRARVALVEQDPWLGVGSLEDAVRLGRPDARRDEVLDALHAAGLDADGLLARLDDGVDAAVGDGGHAVSGGERQRIALARALVRGAPVLLLDEPTAHLDPDAEERFLRTLRRLAPQHAILVATHRVGPLAVADRALRLEGGCLQPLSLAEAS